MLDASLIRASSGSRSLSATCVVAQVLRQPVPPSRDRIPGAAARSLHCVGGGLGAARQPNCRREARVYVRPVPPADHAAAPLAAVAARVRRCARGRSGGLFTVPRCAPCLCSTPQPPGGSTQRKAKRSITYAHSARPQAHATRSMLARPCNHRWIPRAHACTRSRARAHSHWTEHALTRSCARSGCLRGNAIHSPHMRRRSPSRRARLHSPLVGPNG